MKLGGYTQREIASSILQQRKPRLAASFMAFVTNICFIWRTRIVQNDLLRFAAAHLSPYRIRGDELIPELCPFCYGGQNADRHTFALNLTDGVYVCKRGRLRRSWKV